jgi:N-methylhydantoinase B
MTAYFRPASLAEAIAIRAGRDVEIIAGGTDVYPNKTTRAGWGRTRHKDVLDITAIPGLDGVEENEREYRLGCLLTWAGLCKAELPPLLEGLKAAAREIGGAQIQNRATLVGNLCTASPAGDGIPNFIALNAEVELRGPRGVRRAQVESFLDGYRRVALQPGEIVTALLIPKRGGAARGAFLKLGARRYLVISIAMAAGVMETDAGGTIVDARLVIGACSAVAQRLSALEERVRGMPLGPGLSRLVAPGDFESLTPLDDVRASAAYRRAAAEALTRDLLDALAGAEAQRAA